jgi:hypothetical protein
LNSGCENLKDIEERQCAVLLARVNLLCQSAIRVPILDWSKEHVRYPHSDRNYRFRRDFAYWLNRPFEAVASGLWRVISVVAPIGSGKTTFLETVAAYIIAVDPGGTLIIGQTDDDVEAFAETRLMPMLDSMPATEALMPAQRKVRKAEIIFPHMPLYLGGANLNTLQSKSCRWVILDEVWLMKRSMVREAIGRTHDRGNAVVIALGQAGVVNDEHDQLHETCQKHDYGWQCPECTTWHEYNFRRDIKFDNTRDDRGVWNWQALADSVRMVCPSCGTVFSDTEDNRRLLSRSGSYRPIPCNPLPARIGFHYSGLAVWWVPWSTMVLEFVQANEHKKQGDYEPLRQLIQKRFADFWAEDDEAPEVTFQAAGYSQAEYDDGRLIENEVRRFLTVDRQRDHFWAVTRAWRADGSSRLLYADRLLEWSQIIGLAAKYRVAPMLVFIDAGYDTGAVYGFCAEHGYIALKGDQVDEFTHRRGRQSIKRFYSGVQRVSVGQKQALLVRWSNTRIKDILGKLCNGQIAPFEIPADVVADYPDHMTSEIKRDVIDPKTGKMAQRWVRLGRRANHLWDCECLQVVGALMMRLLRLGEAEP